MRIKSVFWERVNIVFEFDEDVSSLKFFLINKRGKRVALPALCSYLSKYNFAINITTAFPNCKEIKRGEWTLIAQKDGKDIPLEFNKKAEKREFVSDNGSVYSVEIEGTNIKVLYRRVFGHHPNVSTLGAVFNLISFYIIAGIFRISRIINLHKGKNVLFTSDSRAFLSGNMELVYNRMIERGLDKQFNIKMCFKENVAKKRKLGDKFRLPWLLGWADVIFVDDEHPALRKIKRNKKTKIIQLWHACGAFKTVGYSRMGKPGGLFVYSKNHRIYSHATVSSSYIAPFYAEAFGVGIDKVVPCGVPRTDVFFSEQYKKQTRDRIFSEMPEIKGKRVIMFAPTFRGSGPSTAHYPTEKVDLDKLALLCRKTDSVVIFKLHFLCRNRIEIPKKYSDIFFDCTENREINDLLFVSDVLITDYSSVVYEASTLSIPMLFYAYDLEEYISSRDFYEPYQSFVPGKIVKDFDSLIASIEQEDYQKEKVEIFSKKNFEFTDGKATDRVVDIILE